MNKKSTTNKVYLLFKAVLRFQGNRICWKTAQKTLIDFKNDYFQHFPPKYNEINLPS